MLLSLVQIRTYALMLKKIINRGLYWIYGFKSHNSYVSLYDITCELRIPPLSAICSISQLCCFRKWKNSSCIINHLTNSIPTMSHYSWTKESRILDKKLNGKTLYVMEKVLLGKRYLQTFKS